MTEKPERITVQVKYKDVAESFSAGSVEEAWLLLNRFFSQFVPSFEIANKLRLSVDLEKLAKDLDGAAAFSAEG